MQASEHYTIGSVASCRPLYYSGLQGTQGKKVHAQVAGGYCKEGRKVEKRGEACLLLLST